MARFLIEATYSKEGISDLIKSPQDRAEAESPVVERVGGRLETFYFAFGDYDAVVIAELPDNVSAAALAMAVGSSPGVSKYKTTVLLTMSEAMEAMGKAGGTGYRSPSG